METITKEARTKNKETLEQHSARLSMKNGDVRDAAMSLLLDKQKGNRVPRSLWDDLVALCVKKGMWEIISKINEFLRPKVSKTDALTCAHIAFKNFNMFDAIGAYQYAKEKISVPEFKKRTDKAYSKGKLSPKQYAKVYHLLGIEMEPERLRFSLTRIQMNFDLTGYLELCAILEKNADPDFIKECIQYQSMRLSSQEFLARMSMLMITPSKEVLVAAAEHAFANGNPKGGRQFLRHVYPLGS